MDPFVFFPEFRTCFTHGRNPMVCQERKQGKVLGTIKDYTDENIFFLMFEGSGRGILKYVYSCLRLAVSCERISSPGNTVGPSILLSM